MEAKCFRPREGRQIPFPLGTCVEYFAKKKEEFYMWVTPGGSESLKINFGWRHILHWVLLPGGMFLILKYQLGQGWETVIGTGCLASAVSSMLMDEF